MLGTTKGYDIVANGADRGTVWKKHGKWHLYRPGRGQITIKGSVRTKAEVGAWLAALFGVERVEFRSCYW